MKINPRIKLIYRIFTAGAALFVTIGYSAVHVMQNAGSQVTLREILNSLIYFKFFTNQTNLMVAVWLVIALIYHSRENKPPILHPKIKGALTTYIVTTCVIYATLLSGGKATWTIVSLLTYTSHYIVPIAFMIDWLLFTEKGKIKYSSALYWLLYPLAYLIFSLAHGTLTGQYLYYFIDVSRLGWGGFAFVVLLLLVFFLLLGLLVIGVNRPAKPAKQAAQP